MGRALKQERFHELHEINLDSRRESRAEEDSVVSGTKIG
jgi:hypothetical protein